MVGKITSAVMANHPFGFWKLILIKLELTSLKIFQGFKISILRRISGRLKLVVC